MSCLGLMKSKAVGERAQEGDCMTEPNPTTLTNVNEKKTHFNAEFLAIYKTMKTQFQGSSHFHLSPSRYMIFIYKILTLTLSHF